jgi:hypothetical protein
MHINNYVSGIRNRIYLNELAVSLCMFVKGGINTGAKGMGIGSALGG